MSDLSMKPCPFCGAKENDDDGLVDGMNAKGTTIFVRCLSCGADGPPVDYVVVEDRIVSWPLAVKAWNRRADDE